MTNDGWQMPDGSGPWTIIIVGARDQPAGRYGERGRGGGAEMTDHPLNRTWVYERRDGAQQCADFFNALLSIAHEHPDEDVFAERTQGVDSFEVALRQGAEIVVSGDNANGIGGDH